MEPALESTDSKDNGSMSKSNASSPSPKPDAQNVNKRPTVQVAHGRAKNRRFNRPQSGRHGGVAHTQTTPPSSLLITPILPHFPVFVSNVGIPILATATYNVMVAKDHRLGSILSLHHLIYVLSLAFFNRIVQCAIHYGTYLPGNASRLRQATEHLLLPDHLAKYIEALGCVEMSNGCKVVPYCQDYRPLTRMLMLDPVTSLEEAGRPIPDGDWVIDREWIVQYANSVARASKSGMRFRKVDNTNFIGRLEMLGSYQILGADEIRPYAPQSMTEAETALGALYRYRNHEQYHMWPGEHNMLLYGSCVGKSFNSHFMVNNLAVEALLSRNRDT